jgi:predicted GNAT family acetyltransferase
MTSGFTVINDTYHLAFVVDLDGEQATIDYRYYKHDIAFLHSYVPEHFRGKGVAKALAETALTFARKENKKIMLYCPFMSKYVREHPEYHDLVDTEFHQTFFSKPQDGPQ